MEFLKSVGWFVLQLVRFLIASVCYIVGFYTFVMNPDAPEPMMWLAGVLFVFGVFLYWRFWIVASIGIFIGYHLVKDR
ncbi:MAG: hypothetical protein HC836_30430 [Richelia sp. RM2_1_2]|nr:hypothetical protein [Richelia sp. RM2_1_2]